MTYTRPVVSAFLTCSFSLSVHATCGDQVVNSWVPFFEPRVRASDLLSRLEIQPTKQAKVKVNLRNGGGKFKVDAIASRSRGRSTVFAEKDFYEPSQEVRDSKAIQKIRYLQKAGRLSEFKVVEILSQYSGKQKSNLIEGQDLPSLIKHYRHDKRLNSILERYRDAVGEVMKSLSAEGYGLHLNSSDLDKSLIEITVFGDRRYRLGDIIFAIAPRNVVVEASTGHMYLVDPF